MTRARTLVLPAMLAVAPPAQAFETAVCTLSPVCGAVQVCPEQPLEIRFRRSTPLDGLWEGVLAGETVAVHPDREPGRWGADGETGHHRLAIDADGAIIYSAPARAARNLGGVMDWRGQCGPWEPVR